MRGALFLDETVALSRITFNMSRRFHMTVRQHVQYCRSKTPVVVGGRTSVHYSLMSDAHSPCNSGFQLTRMDHLHRQCNLSLGVGDRITCLGTVRPHDPAVAQPYRLFVPETTGASRPLCDSRTQMKNYRHESCSS